MHNAGTEGAAECRIKIDGQVVPEAKSGGPYSACQVTVDKP
ncbi:hypothetical protein AB0H88_46530 [Nonomuraea sp. NPDC050680]